MKGRLLALLALAVVVGCNSLMFEQRPTLSPSPWGGPFLPEPRTPAPGATPTSAPSGSCIFTLDVDNETTSEVTVAANTTPLGRVAPQKSRRFYEFTNDYPPLPWSVSVTRTSDGAILASMDFPEGTLSGSITVRDEPEMFAAGHCP